MRSISRRQALRFAASALAAAIAPSFAAADDFTDRIADPEIRAGVRAAIEKNLLPAASQKQYPGHFGHEKSPPRGQGRVLGRALFGAGEWEGHPIGAPKYCEYPVVLNRTMLGNPNVFMT